MKHLGRLSGSLILLALTAVCAAAQGPLSPPERPPVPLSDVDQTRSRDEALQRQLSEQAPKTASADATRSSLVRIPVDSILPRRLSSGNAAVDALILEAAGKHDLDPFLILSIMNQESGYNPAAVSPKGASGLMQLMPDTAARFGVKNIFDPRENVMAGATYLRWLLDKFGDVRLALAGYNAGEGAVEFYGNRIPPFQETQNYVQVIYSRYTRLRGAGATTPAADVTSQPASPEKPPTYNQIVPATSPAGAQAPLSPKP